MNNNPCATKNSDKYFYLYADCIPVRGYTRTMLCDTSRKKMFFINNGYYELLLLLAKEPIAAVQSYLLTEKDLEKFEIFLSFMLDNELGTFVDDISLFPPIQMEWDHPAVITNAIIDVKGIHHPFQKIFNELSDLGCRNLQIRCFDKAINSKLFELLTYVAKGDFKSVQLIVHYDIELLTDETIKKILQLHPALNIVVHSSPFDKCIRNKFMEEILEMGYILYIKQAINSCESCGIINQQDFYLAGIQTFTENILYNGCLNRKIAIDENGMIKNCPSMKNNFGNIHTTALSDVVFNPDFRAKWYINKDQIEICKDCEFRYVCTDCRAYTLDANNIYSKPSKCSYNPYKGEWVNC